MQTWQIALTNTAGLSSFISLWAFILAFGINSLNVWFCKAAKYIMTLGFLALTLAIIIRGIEAQRFPLSNLYESIMWFAWAVMGSYLALSRFYNIKLFGSLASMLALTMFLYGSWLPASQHEISPLVPALVSYWRQIHIPPLIVSYAMFCISGLAALAQLFYSGHIISLVIMTVTLLLAGSAIGLGTYTSIETYILQSLFVGSSFIGSYLGLKNLKTSNPKFKDKEKSNLYKEITYRCVTVGFPLLTFGIITGGLWANHAWGSYWSWDPKESMALATWLSYAAFIHLKIHRECKGSTLSVVALIGVLITMLTYLGFNSLGFSGLHSYGRFKDM